jgi:hypothetical protein
MTGIDVIVRRLPARTENVGHRWYIDSSSPELFDGYIL